MINSIKQSFVRSPRTTTLGLVGLVAFLWKPLILPFIDENPETIPTITVEQITAALAILGIGVAGRDHGVSSETAGAHPQVQPEQDDDNGRHQQPHREYVRK